MDGTIVAKFTFTRSDDDGTGESRPTTNGVNDRRSGEIGETHLAEPATAPCPRPLNRVNKSGQENGEDQEREHFHTFGNSTGYDRCGRRHEDHLEEPVDAAA